MRRSKFSEEQIAMALRQGEVGTPAAEICRKLGISHETLYRWKKVYGGLGVPELRELRQLRDENRRLKQLVADLNLDRAILQESLKKKMVKPAERRQVVEWAQSAFRVTERRACHVIGLARSTMRYKSGKPLQEPLRRRLRELAAVRTYAGYRRLHTYLRREGWPINHKRVYRLYMEEGLALRRKPRRRRRSAVRLISTSLYVATISTGAKRKVGSRSALAIRRSTSPPVTPILWTTSRMFAIFGWSDRLRST